MLPRRFPDSSDPSTPEPPKPSIIRRALSRRFVIASVIALMAVSAGVSWKLFHAVDIDLSIMTPGVHRPLVAVNGKVQRVPSGDYLDPTVLVDTTGCSDTNVIKWNAGTSQFACGAGGAGGGITNAAPNLNLMLSNGTNAVSSGENDDGTTLTSSRKMLIGGGSQFSAGTLYTFNGIAPTTTTGFVVNDTSAHTAFEDLPFMVWCSTCTYDTTGQASSYVGVDIEPHPTHSAGSNALTLWGIYINASITSPVGGDSSEAIHVASGGGIINDINGANFGPTVTTTLATGGALADLSGSTAIKLNQNITSPKVTIPGDSSNTPQLSLGVTTLNDGTSIQTKNTNATQSVTGVDLLADTTILSTESVGVFMTRGAGGGGGVNGAHPSGMALIGNAGSIVVGSAASDLAIFNQLTGGNIIWGADASTFKAQMKLDQSGNLTLGVNGQGHLKTSGTAPALTSCGTSPTITGTDLAGVVTTGSAATTCTITFTNTYTTEPPCLLLPMGTATMPVYTVSATAITVSVDIASTKYHYMCVGF